MTRILLARHGETEWNAERRVQGWQESPLNARGMAQAQALSERLSRTPLAAVYASDLSRAAETARLIAAPHDLPVVLDAALRERGYGVWEGLTEAELERDYAESWHRFQYLRRWDEPVPQGETWEEIQWRFLPVLHRIVTDHPGQDETVLIVGHGGSLRLAILDALAAPLLMALRLRLDNASLSRLDYSGPNEGRVIFLNDTGHCEGLLCTAAAF
jgi:broad specificity phosphatase PhoE